jgi:hypothetical protein
MLRRGTGLLYVNRFGDSRYAVGSNEKEAAGVRVSEVNIRWCCAGAGICKTIVPTACHLEQRLQCRVYLL